MRDISNFTAVTDMGSCTANAALTTVDIMGYDSVMFVITGAGVGAASLTVKHGDAQDNLEAADSLCLIQDNAAASAKVKKLGYIGGRRYVQVTSSVAGNGVAILQNATATPRVG